MVLRKSGIHAVAGTFTEKMNPYLLLDDRNDIPPVAPLPIIRRVDNGSARRPEPSAELELAESSWWLIPRLANARGKAPTFNARAETVRSLWSFKHSFVDRRCLVVVDGFYEWPADKKSSDRRRRLIRRSDRAAITFAGLWDRAVLDTGEEIDTCTVITTQANAMLRAVPHHRMPVILDGDARAQWLSPNTSLDAAEALLTPRVIDDMELLITPGAYTDDAECILVDLATPVSTPPVLDLFTPNS
jgi:putative SOS response-associated peptidase YedK